MIEVVMGCCCPFSTHVRIQEHLDWDGVSGCPASGISNERLLEYYPILYALILTHSLTTSGITATMPHSEGIGVDSNDFDTLNIQIFTISQCVALILDVGSNFALRLISIVTSSSQRNATRIKALAALLEVSYQSREDLHSISTSRSLCKTNSGPTQGGISFE